jgi:peptidoglycan/xylan/chitin deacetylase (PgdA/CDA1 family)
MAWSIITFVLILVGVVDALAIALWYACSRPRSQVLGPALVRGPAKGKRIALTFDDGPFPPYTEQILDILQRHGVQATFFVCGRNVEQHPEIVRRIHAEGHTLGNHTWSHPYLYFLSRRKMAEEIDRTQKAISEATGQVPRLFRPPYGGRWFGLYPLLREREMELVQWSVNTFDWKLDADGVLACVRAGLHPGAVVLLHDGRQTPGGYLHRLLRSDSRVSAQRGPSTDQSATAEALPAVIDYARRAGYEFVSVEDFCSN